MPSLCCTSAILCKMSMTYPSKLNCHFCLAGIFTTIRVDILTKKQTSLVIISKTCLFLFLCCNLQDSPEPVLSPSLKAVKFFGDLLEMSGDLDVLRTMLFALMAADTIPGFRMCLRKIIIINHLRGHIPMLEQCKVLRNRDMLRTLYRTVAAAGTGNRHIRLNQTRRLLQSRSSSSFIG